MLRFHACELQIERKYADYQRVRPRLADIDYDIQAAHAYCHVPTRIDPATNTIEFHVPLPWESYFSTTTKESIGLVQGNYAVMYELLSFCQSIATQAGAPNTKRPLCSAGSPTAALTTLGFSLYASGGLANTLKIVATGLAALSSCGGGGGSGGGGGNSNQSNNTGSTQNNVPAKH